MLCRATRLELPKITSLLDFEESRESYQIQEEDDPAETARQLAEEIKRQLARPANQSKQRAAVLERQRSLHGSFGFSYDSEPGSAEEETAGNPDSRPSAFSALREGYCEGGGGGGESKFSEGHGQ